MDGASGAVAAGAACWACAMPSPGATATTSAEAAATITALERMQSMSSPFLSLLRSRRGLRSSDFPQETGQGDIVGESPTSPAGPSTAGKKFPLKGSKGLEVEAALTTLQALQAVGSSPRSPEAR
jgi:hypothetical protein